MAFIRRIVAGFFVCLFSGGLDTNVYTNDLEIDNHLCCFEFN